jgi:hypothetical protein
LFFRGESENFTALKVLRQCPLVLLVKAKNNTVVVLCVYDEGKSPNKYS